MQHKIILPENAQLQSVFINNKSQPIRQEGRHITLPIIPGTQNIELRFQQPIGMQQYFHDSPRRSLKSWGLISYL